MFHSQLELSLQAVPVISHDVHEARVPLASIQEVRPGLQEQLGHAWAPSSKKQAGAPVDPGADIRALLHGQWLHEFIIHNSD